MSADNEELLRLFVDEAPVAIAMFDRDMHYIAASRRWISDYGLTGTALRGRSHYDVFPDLPEHFRARHRQGLAGEVVSAAEERFERADGRVYWIRWEVRPWYGTAGIGGIILFTEDISERKRSEERILQLNAELETHVRDRTSQLEDTVADLQQALADAEGLRRELREQAIRDPLTGLFNRRYLEETLDREVARATRAQSTLGVVMLDLDKFKLLNDTFGHTAGDVALREVGHLLRENVRASDVACRYGGDEFVVVMPDTSLENAARKADALLCLFKLAPSGLESSMGVVAFPSHGRAGAELLKAADAALYRAKQAGGNRVVVA
jgi:diguanylate cyclase (GGDEF)-like protein/PAS domain S-box-containing protein